MTAPGTLPPSSHTMPTLTVDLEAIAANTRDFAARIPGELMAVVKADGFGHGTVDMARAAVDSGATWLGVTTVSEALVLRDAGLQTRMLSWLNPVAVDFATAIQRDVDVAVPGLEHLVAVARAAARCDRPARIHLHLDCGMTRDGASMSDWALLCRKARVAQSTGLVLVVGVMGHLGCAETPGDPHNEAGLVAFERGVRALRTRGLHPDVRHLAATAATLTDPRTHFDLVRVGAGLVGIDPSGTTRLRSGLILTAPVVSVRDVPAGTPVGYGHSYVTERRTRLALLPVGYADGIPRSTSNCGQVALRGRRRDVVGRVSMDQLVIDVGTDPICPGEVATIFGPGRDGEPTVAEWAGWAGTIEHEVITGLGARLARRVVAPRRPQPSRHHRLLEPA